jgi:hypothetical protein
MDMFITCPDLDKIFIVEAARNMVDSFCSSYWHDEVGPTATYPAVPPFFLLPSSCDRIPNTFSAELYEASENFGCTCKAKTFLVLPKLS